MKLNKLKFLRNIIICVVALGVVSFILDMTPGFKRDKYKDITNIIIKDKNLTEELQHPIYISDKGTVYLSKEDVENFFNTKIYYEEAYDTLITITETKVGSIPLKEKTIYINGSKKDILETIIQRDEITYLPISEMTLIYNIEINYIPETDIVIIDKLDAGIIKADVSEDTSIRYKARKLSKKVAEIKKGEKVSCFYTTSKGWTLIRTEKGELGYVKANTLDNEYILRQDMKKKGEAKEILINSTELTIYKENVKTKITIQNIVDVEKPYEKTNTEELWVILSNENLEEYIDNVMSDYKKREELINAIINKMVKNNLSGIIIDFTGFNNYENVLKFVNELMPQLREIGITTGIKINEGIKKEDFIKIVDYIIK